MDEDAVNSIKEQIDAGLDDQPETVGIALGHALFDEFWQRGLLTTEKLGLSESKFGLESVTAYRKTHFVFPRMDLDEYAFEIGKASAPKPKSKRPAFPVQGPKTRHRKGDDD